MAILAEGSPEMVALESLVDRVGLPNVLYALAVIAECKADHLRSNWQDERTATLWTRQAVRLGKAAVAASPVRP